MSNIAILSDSTCDLSQELLQKYSVTINPLYVNLGDRQYRDSVDITPQDIYDYVSRTGALPKTAAPSIGDHIEFLRPFVEAGKEIIYFTISSTMSANNNNARLAAEEFDAEIYVVDSENLSVGIGLQIIKAAELANEGRSAKEIYEYILEMRSRVDASFVLDRLDYLHKGGRCSGVAALGANLLKLHPCIEVKNGKMEVGKKYRGKTAEILKAYAADRLKDIDDIDLDRIFITDSGCSKEIIDGVYDVVSKAAHFKEILFTQAGCTITGHCGDNCLGVLFVHKKK